ncbi:helix-turn-helix domain-containing protein [Enterococcus sp. BWT-B8]|uniref:helix-turn-helix domain-containing protein n=1 Tax=unclassified Enterococcus TaxID=2608891 RepID=UPI001E5EFA8C|nr:MULTISPECIES: helix-turn-helix domain-containing protein [unclassified Enterococcus]MCB5950963.1 helix-turn-helix domain-containing protein [Enterococcus sp. BWT-B8]MCB5955597.1 helix-turn-helix domain-containing protein [Enterococcus sp. CWB-B31]
MKIQEILGFETRKMLEILTLFQSRLEPISAKFVAEQLYIHAKTAEKYLLRLQQCMKDYGFSKWLQLEFQENDKVILRMKNTWYLEKFRLMIIFNTPEIFLLEKTLTADKISIKELALRLNESEALVRKRITKLRQWLKSYQLTLKHHTLELTGSEHQIREFIFQIHRLIFQENIQLKDCCLENQINQLTQDCILFFQMKMNHLQEQYLRLLIQIQLNRVNTGNPVMLKTDLKNYCLRNQLFQNFSKQIKKSSFFKLSQVEEMYLFLNVKAHFSFTFGKLIQEKIVYENSAAKTTVYKYASSGAKGLRKIFEHNELIIDIQIFVSLLGFHLYYEMNAGFLYEDLSALKDLVKYYPNTFERVTNMVSILKEEFNHFNKIDGNQLLLRYFFILSEACSPIILEKRKNIYFVLEWNLEQKKRFIKKIANFFTDRKNIRLIDGGLHTEYQNADVILTTSVHRIFKKKASECPVIFIAGMDEYSLLKQLNYFLEDKN